MTTWKDITYQKPILLNTFFDSNQVRKIYLSKSYFSSLNQDQYFIKSFLLTPQGKLICQGYIYFYLDSEKKESQFIGAYVKEEYRQMGLASLLFSLWIKFCLEEGFYNLKTNKKQRKPFLLYLLKTFSFELKNPSDYETLKSTIYIYKMINDYTKYLYFKNEKQKEQFIKSEIMKKDNYQILEKIDENTILLNQVILSKIYQLQNENFAYTKSLNIQKKYK